MVEAVKEALIEASRSGLLSKLIEKIGWLHAESQKRGSGTGDQKGGFGPGVRAPPLELRLPRIPLGLLALTLVAGAAVVLFLGSHRLAAAVSSVAAGIARRRGDRPELGGAPPVLKLYWAAVRVAERASGVRMEASATHREFLAVTEGRLGGLEKPFKELTRCYELCRYAGIASGRLEERALRHYGEMERGRRAARP
jgi:hypothetical protein